MNRSKFSTLISFVLLWAVLLCGCNTEKTSLHGQDIATSSAAINNITILNGGRIDLNVGDNLQFITDVPKEFLNDLIWEASGSAVTVSKDGTVTAVEIGTAAVTVTLGDFSDTALIVVTDERPSVILDPYVNVTKEAFYANYTPAKSFSDAYFRTLHGFMSGNITIPDQAPIISQYRPVSNGMFVRNSDTKYPDQNSYTVTDAYGKEVFTVYKGGAYITLEEVAAYLYAFGDVPANYVDSKNEDPKKSVWGEYLRLNHNKFSGNTAKYPYEPELPNISGCGGELYYYEIDIGTTGTDCDPAYSSEIYNNGNKITRGAARIVYTRYDKNNNLIIEPNEKYLFYTYNHYNDFMEYLNYYGGWGEMFGNITGGGKISSKTDYNPTVYVPTVFGSLMTSVPSNTTARMNTSCVFITLPKRKIA